jgi:transcriptional antiterminator NusG
MSDKENKSPDQTESGSGKPEMPVEEEKREIGGAGDVDFVDADDVEVDEEDEKADIEIESEKAEKAAEPEVDETGAGDAGEVEEPGPEETEPEVGEPPAGEPPEKPETEAAPPAAETEPAGETGDTAAGAGTTEEEPEDTGPPKRWYVVHTYSGHENKVKENIQKMINASPVKDHFGQIIVPTEEVAEMKKGKKTITTKKFFPSYILIEMHMSDESRHLVSDIPGVTSFVGTASGPQPLSKAEVERILGRMDKEKQTIIPDIPFTLGEHIRIKDGPFSDFTGIIDEINAERGKLKVLVSIFGRETPVELDFLQVENL